MKSRGLIVFACMLSFHAWGATTAGDAGEDLLERLKKVEAFRASFSQNIRSSTGEKISDTRGEMVIRRPNRFYWKTQKPDPILVVADGKYLWTYDLDLAQATRQNLERALQDSPATVLAGSLDRLKQNFTIQYAKSGACRTRGSCFELKNKKKDTTFRNILIGFEDNKIREIKMSDPLGQRVYTIFSNVQINGPVEASLFRFVPPKGVDIIRYD